MKYRVLPQLIGIEGAIKLQQRYLPSLPLNNDGKLLSRPQAFDDGVAHILSDREDASQRNTQHHHIND